VKGNLQSAGVFRLMNLADNPLAVGGYTAQDINNLAPFMDGLGVFTFMVTLREDPAKAKEYIEGGFKRK
jgi:hypothetical protein